MNYPKLSQLKFNDLSWFIIPPITYILDRLNLCSTADDIDMWAENRGWWHR